MPRGDDTMSEHTDLRVYQTVCRRFRVLEMKTGFNIYNESGIRVATFPGLSERNYKMACIAADALAVAFVR